MPERLTPANSAPICATPTAPASLKSRVSSRRPTSLSLCAVGCSATSLRTRGAAADAFADEQDDAVDGEEDRRGERLGEQRAQRVFEREAGEPGRDGRDDEQPGHAFVGRLESAGSQCAEEAADDAHPVGAEVDEQRDRGRDVQRDDEREVERLVGGLGAHEVSQPSQAGIEHRVAEARDREQLGDALQQADHDRLEVAEHGPTHGTVTNEYKNAARVFDVVASAAETG